MLQKLKNIVAHMRRPAWMNSEVTFNQHTPDIVDLEAKSKWLFFVYDCMMKGHWQHDLLKDAEFKHIAFTRHPFELWQTNSGYPHDFPIAMETHKKSAILPPWAAPVYNKVAMATHVRGELYLVPTELIHEVLDKARFNTVHFQRKRVPLELPYRIPSVRNTVWEGNEWDMYIKPMEAWMYVGRPQIWQDQFDGGYRFKPAPVFKPNSGWINSYQLFLRNDVKSGSK